MRPILVLAGWLMLPGVLLAAEVDYVREVKPVLAKRCYACHGAFKQKSGLRVDTVVSLKRGGDSGPAVVAGNSGESLIVEAIAGADDWRMPPEGEPLSDGEIATIKSWIDQGAHAPSDEAPQADPRKHWAFRTPTRPDVPRPQNKAWADNPVDAFLAAEHEKRGLQRRPQADKETLLRRLSLDLIGLVPTPAERQAFLADDAPDAYEKVVDRLLADPRYGERWGRHWMDVWRYSDWDGYAKEVRESQPHIWRWRDWILESLNQDKGYDQMIVEMLAADEAAPEDRSAQRATGYLVRSWYKFNRNVWLDNAVEHTSKAFLGITWNCARCHDHKYDPIAQADYYRLRAFFEPYDIRTDRLPGQSDLSKDGLVRIYDAKAQTPTYLFERGDEKRPAKDRPLEPTLPAFLARLGQVTIQPVSLPTPAFYPGIQQFVRDETLNQARADVSAKEAGLQKAKQDIADAQRRIAALAGPGEDKPNVPRSPLLVDDFSAPKPELWEQGAGTWRYENGRLRQSEVGDVECRLISKSDMPRDFAAEFRLKITGGNQWRSVGMSFDIAESGDYIGVYLSNYSGGPKIQIMVQRNGQKSYPAEGMKPFPVKRDTEHTLEVVIRDQLVNVAVDGQFALAYKLPASRQKGPLSLWTFDASAEFLKVRIDSLPSDRQLAETSKGAPPVTTEAGAKAALAKAEAMLPIAEKALAASRANVASVEARIAADRAKYTVPPQSDADRLAQEAHRLERQCSLLQAQEKQLRSEQALNEAKQAANPASDAAKKTLADAEKAWNEANKAVETAQGAAGKEGSDYAPIGSVYPTSSTGRRLALARWMTSRENPLTARVAVNHIWMRHFGEPLVPTVFDFGLNGRPPALPALLDWLAVELMDQRWSMKSIHRLLVTSRAYRMDSSTGGPNDANLTRDPANAFLWRMSAHRMEAELVRDNVLYVAGSLDPTRGGPDLDPGSTAHRRSLYFRHAKEKRVTFLKLFDSANVSSCYRRSESVMPQQALALANSPLAREQARVLAGRIGQESGVSDSAFIEGAFVRILGRDPTHEERDACVEYLSEQAGHLAEKASLSAFNSGPASTVKPSVNPRERAREDLVHVLFNHNDFVTIR